MTKSTAWQRLTRRTEFWIFLVLIVAIVGIYFVSDGQLAEPNHIVTILRAMIVDGLLGMACLIVIVAGGFDLSFPTVAACASCIATSICVSLGWSSTNPLAGIILSIIIGAVLGMLNGLLIAHFHLNTMLVTLSSSTFFLGIALGILKLREISADLPNGLRQFGEWSLFEVSSSSGIKSSMSGIFIIYVLTAIIVAVVLRQTMFGRALYSIGGSEIAAERAGYNVEKIKFVLYTVVGAMSGFAGIIRVCLAQQAIPKALLNREFVIIPAVILGGGSFFGGKGTVFGTVTAIALITLVTNSMLLIGVDSYWQKFFNGLVIIIGIMVSSLQAKRNKG